MKSLVLVNYTRALRIPRSFFPTLGRVGRLLGPWASRRQSFAWCFLLCALVVLLGAGCTKEGRKNHYLADANRDFAAGKYDRAEIEYRRVLQLSPLEPTALAKLGLLYYDQGRPVQAFAFLKKSIELNLDDPELRLKLSLAEFSLRDFRAARQDAESVLQKQHGQPEALAILADTAFSPKEIQDTVAQIERLRQQDQDRSGYHLALGALAIRQGQISQAESEFNRALELDSKLPAVHMALAGLALQKGDLARADQAFQAAVQLAPPRSPFRLQYANFKFKTGGVAEARRMATEMTQKTPDFVPAWLFLAQLAADQNQSDESSALVQKVLTRDPLNFDALLLGGELMLRRGDSTNAIVQFERAIKTYGPQPKAKYDLAVAYLMNKQVPQALASLREAIAANTNYLDAILLQANLNLRQGNASAAISSLSRLAQQQPQSPQPLLLLARAYASDRQVANALEVYHRMAGTFTNLPTVLFEVGNSLVMMNQGQEAAKVYRQIATTYPTNAEVLVVAGINLAALKQNEEARRIMEKSLALQPHLFPAVEGLVDLDLDENRRASAVARVQKEIDSEPKAAVPWLLLAKIHITAAEAEVTKANLAQPAGSRPLLWADVPAVQADAHEAEQALIKAISLGPDLPTSYYLLARLYVALNKQQLALGRLTDFVARTNDVTSWMQIGVIHEQMTNYPAARDAYEQVLKINPNSGAAINNLAYLYAEKLNDLDRAYNMAQKAVRLRPADPAVSDTLGWVLYQRGDFTQAADFIEQAAERLPANPEIQFHLGMVSYMLGQEEPARVALQRALESGQDFSRKEQARARLAILNLEVKTASSEQLAALQKQLDLLPNDLVALARLAGIYERDGAVDKAIQTYQTELKYSPQNAQAMYNLALLYSRVPGQARQALEMAKEAHAAAAQDARISALLGWLVYQAGDYKWSNSLLDEASRKIPDDPQLWYRLAWAGYSLGRTAEAVTAMNAAVKAGLSGDSSQDARRFLAMLTALKDAGTTTQAALEAQRVLSGTPDYVPALMVSAGAQAQQGKYEEAAKLYDQALARFPLFTPATRDLAVLCFEHLGDERRAYDLSTKAREAFPEDSQIARTLGILAYKRSDFSRSAQLLAECGRQRQNDAEVFYYLGLAQYQLKSKAASKASLQHALALNLEPGFAAEAKRVLSELQ